MGECQNCTYSQDIQWLKDEAKKNSDAHQKIYDKLENQGTAQALIDERYRNIMKELEDLKSTLDDLKTKPSKHWNSLVTALISSGAGGIVGYILSKILGA